ncbi:MAG TPA: BolA family protein [Sphingomonas sp.]|jgi:BolA protein
MDNPATPSVADRITVRLNDLLQPTRLEVVNDSHRHAGHMGDDGSGETHWTVRIESTRFAGLSRVQRQRLVNQALADLLDAPIHALAMKVSAPGE